MSRPGRPILAIALAILLSSASTPLQAADDASPEGVVKKAVEAMNGGDTGQFAKAMHPEALKQFRGVMMSVLEAATKDGQGNQILAFFPSVQDADGLKKLDDVAFFADYLKSAMARDPTTRDLLAGAKIDILGHVDEVKDLSHVLYRLKVKIEDGATIEKIVTNAVRKDGPGWKLLLLGDVETMTVMMKQRMTGKRAVPDLKSIKLDYLGKLAEGQDRVHLLYRAITPFGENTLRKDGVFTISKDDPEWEDAMSGKPDAILKVIQKKANP